MGMKLSGTLFITEGTTPTLYAKLLADKSTRPGERKDFSTPYTKTNVSTLFTSTENDIPVYYFAGDARDNWVKFGTWSEDAVIYKTSTFNTGTKTYGYSKTLEECNALNLGTCTKIVLASKGDPMYWRIIRTNSNGSIRLLYSGTSYDTTAGYIGNTCGIKILLEIVLLIYKIIYIILMIILIVK